MMDQLQRVLEPYARKFTNLMGLGLVKIIYASDEMQKLQVKMLEGELRDKLSHVQNYGFSIHPHPDSEALVLFPNGDKTEGLVISVNDRRYYLQVERGEVAIYDDLKQKVHLTRDGIIIKSDQKITLDAPETHVTKKLIIDGLEFNAHTHTDVEPGGGTSGGVKR